MNHLFRIMCCIACLYTIPNAYSQVPQSLIEKAKASGLTEAQIRQQLSRQMQDSDSLSRRSRSNAATQISDRAYSSELTNMESLEDQQKNNIPEKELNLIVFGREIFSNKNLTFAPDLNAPTPKGYVLSTGDELMINVWGDSELNLKLTISPEGTIVVPNLGPITLSGLTVEAAEHRIRRDLSRIMSNIYSEEGSKTFVSVSLGQIRRIKVHIVGEAVAPGTYTLSSFSSLFNALYAAGGVNDIGSLRSIKVFRHSREVANLDVYDYLLHGKYNTNIRLEDNDMIMVGTYDQLVSISGKVKRNRIFELRKGETIHKLLEMAGGFKGDAYTKDVRVKRKSGSRYQLATVTENKFNTFTMHDGDSCVVDSVIPFYENRLQITGAVWRPGEYELDKSLSTVKQLIEQAAGVKGDEFAGRAQIIRINKDFTNSVVAVDIKGILNGTSPDIELQPEDQLHIPSLFDLREAYTIRVAGAINSSDTVLPYRHNMTIEDAIILAGGLKESAATINVEVARRLKDSRSNSNDNQTAKEFMFSLTDNMKIATGEKIFTLEPFDEVYVRFSPGYQEQQVVRVNGEVMFAGNYVLAEKNARLSDIISKAGGVTSDAYIKGASLKRKLTKDELRRVETLLDLSANKKSKDSVDVNTISLKDYSVGIDLQKALMNPKSADDVVLRDGDELYIPQLQSTVKVSGAVSYPNSVTFTKGMSVRDCLSQAGGYNDIARKYPIVVYMNGKVATTHRTGIFFKNYPKIEPGCEIVVPAKTQNNKNSLPEILSISSSATSMAAMVTSIINTLTR